ncbi:DUF6163 family protein [Rhizobium sp. LjRoot254]|uniref:DUF6163 family protein n=1 Tax=Rhizobium sp. LjRoot254 TaxID=3342297 RepID=UPI003ECE98AA
MTDTETLPQRTFFLPELLMTIFMRMVAVACLWFALDIWSDLIGYGSNGILRFDLLDTDMQAAAAALSVLYPVAAIGLWLKGSWGPVVWTVTAAVEVARHESFPGIFGTSGPTLLMIVSTVALYLALRITLWLKKPVRAGPKLAAR